MGRLRSLVVSASGIRIWSRNGHDMMSRYPEIHGLAAGARTSVVLDGEIVCLVRSGPSRFSDGYLPRNGERTGAASRSVSVLGTGSLWRGESGYGRDLVEQLPRLTRSQLRALQHPGRIWDGDDPVAGEVKFLEWSLAGGLRHATLVSYS